MAAIKRDESCGNGLWRDHTAKVGAPFDFEARLGCEYFFVGGVSRLLGADSIAA